MKTFLAWFATAFLWFCALGCLGGGAYLATGFAFVASLLVCPPTWKIAANFLQKEFFTPNFAHRFFGTLILSFAFMLNVPDTKPRQAKHEAYNTSNPTITQTEDSKNADSTTSPEQVENIANTTKGSIKEVNTLATTSVPQVVDSITFLESKITAKIAKRKYKEALPMLNKVLFLKGQDDSLLMERAKCFAALKDNDNAMADLKSLNHKGREAKKLYEKINPEIKEVSSYCSRCCDGSLSPTCATGRGACSHHGGVCNPREPIYNTRRKYENLSFNE